MHWTKLIALLAAFGLPTTASAGSQIGTITELYMGTDYGGMVFIAISGAKTNNPACSTNNTFSFVLPLTTALQSQMYAALLAARATGAQVTLNANGLCDTYSGVETLVYITY
jgi:hypothetical protein